MSAPQICYFNDYMGTYEIFYLLTLTVNKTLNCNINGLCMQASYITAGLVRSNRKKEIDYGMVQQGRGEMWKDGGDSKFKHAQHI